MRERRPSFLRDLLRLVRIAAGAIAAALAVAWGSAALWVDGPAERPLAAALAAGFAALSGACLLLVRPRRRGFAAFAVLLLVVLAWWLAIRPRNDRPWQRDVARLASAEFDGDLVTVHNVRDFDYRSETDFTERWEERTYDLSRVRGVDLFLSFWGPTLIAHTIVSWEFDDGPPLAISIETRKEEGESYSAVLGFFRQYELYYVVADERDVVGVRANQRGEQVFLYRMRGTPEFARRLLVAYLDEVNELAAKPKWYNALTHNCTTTIRLHVQQADVQNAWDWRILANGKGDEMLYERGTIDTTLAFPELRARSDVTEKARAAAAAPDFSARIRDGLPARPGP
jgi:Domain of unknown function (DUF4105)